MGSVEKYTASGRLGPTAARDLVQSGCGRAQEGVHSARVGAFLHARRGRPRRGAAAGGVATIAH